jgi:glycosyltransferase involved in cell wall biosynthesis
MKKIAFVIPWYSKNISGGAEHECKGIVEHLHKAGANVEIITTCVKDFNSDWNKNYYAEGIELINDIPVRRFKVRKRDTKAFDQVNYKLMNNKPISLEEEDIYFKEMVNSIDLENYIQENQDKYESFVFIPYMFGTTYNGSKICPSNSVLIPCLHDESYAYMTRLKEMFERVSKMIFHAKPEFELASRLYDLSKVKVGVLGEGIDTDFEFNAERFRNKYKMHRPFILYAGRKDAGKKVDVLVKYFEKLCTENEDIDLVLIGGGNIDIPTKIKNRVHDLGFVAIQDKYDAYSAAMCLCQPSINESFSIVIMESWITGVPVLVNQKCDVTTNFVRESNGGLYFNNYNEFKECVLLYHNNRELNLAMGKLGQNFVKNNFSWDVIVEKYKNFLFED